MAQADTEENSSGRRVKLSLQSLRAHGAALATSPPDSVPGEPIWGGAVEMFISQVLTNMTDGKPPAPPHLGTG